MSIKQHTVAKSLQQPDVEIELKIRLSDSGLNHLYEWLNCNANFVETVFQTDYYFDNPEQSWFKIHPDGYKYALKYLRVRTTDKGDFICYKDWTDCVNSVVSYCKDIEIPINDYKKHIKLIENLGYTDRTVISKLRESYRYGDLQIDIDKLDKIGIFVEFEIKKRKYRTIKAEYKRIFDFIKQIGILDFRIQKQGFVILSWNPDFNFDTDG